MNESQIEKIKSISIRLLLTIPAILIGIFAASYVILNPLFKPLKDLWFPKDSSFEEAAAIALSQPISQDLKDLN